MPWKWLTVILTFILVFENIYRFADFRILVLMATQIWLNTMFKDFKMKSHFWTFYFSQKFAKYRECFLITHNPYLISKYFSRFHQNCIRVKKFHLIILLCIKKGWWLFFISHIRFPIYLLLSYFLRRLVELCLFQIFFKLFLLHQFTDSVYVCVHTRTWMCWHTHRHTRIMIQVWKSEDNGWESVLSSTWSALGTKHRWQCFSPWAILLAPRY